MSAHNLCVFSKIIKNNVYPCKPPFYYIITGFRGGGQSYKVCFRDGTKRNHIGN